MSKKSSSSATYYTISPKSDAKSGTFINRSSTDGRFTVRTMNGKVFEGASNAANTKLREVSGKFSHFVDMKK